MSNSITVPTVSIGNTKIHKITLTDGNLRSRGGGRTANLSELFTDPRLKAAFQRAEKDSGNAFAVPAPKAPVLTGGQAVMA